MSKFDVVTIGAAVLDIFMKSEKFRVVQSDSVPGGVAMCEVYGGKMEIEKVEIISGGGATNTAVSFARKDLRVAVVAEMGNDPQALLVHKELEQEGVDTKFLVQEDKETTAVSVILISDDGGRSIMVHRGASAQLTQKDLPFEQLETRWVHISSLGGNLGLLKTILQWTKKTGVRVSLNPGITELKQKDKLLPLLSLVEILFLNKDELSELQNASLGSYVVVVTDGGNGGYAVINNKKVEYSADKVKNVIDTTGAGDAFASGMIAGVLYGKSYEQALEWGKRNATSVLSYIGAKKGLLSLGQIS